MTDCIHHETISAIGAKEGEGGDFDIIEFTAGEFTVMDLDRPLSTYGTLAEAQDAARIYAVAFDDDNQPFRPGQRVLFTSSDSDSTFKNVVAAVQGRLTAEQADAEVGYMFSVWPTGADKPVHAFASELTDATIPDDEGKVYMLNDQQKTMMRVYGGGDFAYLAEGEYVTEQALKHVGDTLLTFLVIELASSEDCDSPDEAIARIDTAVRELHAVQRALENA